MNIVEIRKAILGLSLFLFPAFTWAANASDLQVTAAALNVRTSPGAKNSANLVRGCQVKKGDILKATDFEFVDGVPWCKVAASAVEGCTSVTEVWVVGSSNNIKELNPYIDPSYQASEALKTQANCPTCVDKEPGPQLPDLSNKAIRLDQPIKMTLCEGDACNCRGMASNWGFRLDPVMGGGQTRFHGGIDISTPRKTPIYAVADGVVTLAARNGGYGLQVHIQHMDELRSSDKQIEKDEEGKIMGVKTGQSVLARACGIFRTKNVDTMTSTYSHLHSFAPMIGTGAQVKKGQLIGYVNSTGRSTGDHLHFEVLVEGMKCQAPGNSGQSCDPRIFHGFPPRSSKGTLDYTCSIGKVEK